MRTLKIIFGSFACGGLALVLHVFSAVHLRCRHGQQPSYSGRRREHVVGVAQAGYSFWERLPIFLLIFLLPVDVAVFVKWKVL
jgi:hypothetical protein